MFALVGHNGRYHGFVENEDGLKGLGAMNSPDAKPLRLVNEEEWKQIAAAEGAERLKLCSTLGKTVAQ